MKFLIFSSFLIFLLIIISTTTSSIIPDDPSTTTAEDIEEYAPIINLKNFGKIRGLKLMAPLINSSATMAPIYLYQGIKYGQAKRFELSVPADKLSSDDEIYNATKYRDACPQPQGWNQLIEELNETNTINEDCLYLNVWTSPQALKSSNKNDLRPVMVWIHGGGFRGGAIFSKIYDGGILASDGDMIIVSIAYRLGPFGFLYSGTEEAPGNQGLYDQILALKWIQNHIESFGGDPNQVTLFGESAGSISIGALILSAKAQGLFHRAIMQSGAPNSDVVFGNTTTEFEKMLKLAKNLNCSQSEILPCLRQKTMNEILKADLEIASNAVLSMLPLYGTDFLPESPVETLKSGNGVNKDVDLIFGVNRDEGTIFVLSDEILDPKLTLEKTKLILKKLFKQYQSYTTSFSVEDVIKFYTKNLNEQDNPDEFRLATANAIGDYFLVCPTILFGEAFKNLSSKNSNDVHHQNHFYSYRLMMITKSMVLGPKWIGVAHGQDVVFIFGLPYRLSELKFSNQERQLSRDMILAWKRFAKFGKESKMGNTDVEWLEAFTDSSNSIQTMALNSEDYHMNGDYFQKNCNEFWKSRIFD